MIAVQDRSCLVMQKYAKIEPLRKRLVNYFIESRKTIAEAALRRHPNGSDVIGTHLPFNIFIGGIVNIMSTFQFV